MLKHLLAAALVAGCGSDVEPLDVPASRTILEYTGSSAVDANEALKPAGFTGPDEHVCAADPTRVYIGELFRNGINDIEVHWHWAPVVPGPHPGHETLDQPEWSLSGDVVGANDSGDDVLADHPFGLDVNFDVKPDAPYAFMPFQADVPGTLHCEIETRIYPREAFGYRPAAGMRTLLRGVWVLDCGHPPYGAEMHPPTFLAFAKPADAVTTDAWAFVAPYRSSLLFDPDSGLADAFANTARFDDSGTEPFSKAFVNAVLRAVVTRADNLSAAALMVANHFDPLDFLVCAPLPRPDGATLDAQWRFVERTGIDVRVDRDDASGCVRVQAEMGSDYVPMPLSYAHAEWPWDQLSQSAGHELGQPIDVRQEIIDYVKSTGLDANVPALQADHGPLIDAYAALMPLAGADAVEPVAIVPHADTQPFPFYGRVHVAWKTR